MYQGWRFGDLMYVTKRRMDEAVTTMKSQMENVSSALQVWSLAGCVHGMQVQRS